MASPLQNLNVSNGGNLEKITEMNFTNQNNKQNESEENCFTKVKTGYANQGDYYTNIDGVEIVKCCSDCESASIHDIYTREVIEEEWRPEANCGYYYYTPRINSAGVASFKNGSMALGIILKTLR